MEGTPDLTAVQARLASFRGERDGRLFEEAEVPLRGSVRHCCFTVQKDGQPYSELAHIKPISLRTADLDVKDNLLVLCANHHKMLDYGAFPNRLKSLIGTVRVCPCPPVNQELVLPEVVSSLLWTDAVGWERPHSLQSL